MAQHGREPVCNSSAVTSIQLGHSSWRAGVITCAVLCHASVKPTPRGSALVLEKFDKFVLGLFCCAVAAVGGYIAIVSLAHWTATGDMLYFRAFDPDRISTRPRIGRGESLWAYRTAVPGSHDWYSSLLAYLCIAAAAPVVGWIGVVKGFGVRTAERLQPFIRACGMVGGVLFASLLLLRIGGYLFG